MSPLQRIYAIVDKDIVFIISSAKQVTIIYLRQIAVRIIFLHKYADTNSLLDVKYIFIFTSIGGSLFSFGTSMKINYIDFIKYLQKTLSHLPVDETIKKTIIGDKSKNTIAIFFDIVLAKPDKLYIIIWQWLYILFI